PPPPPGRRDDAGVGAAPPPTPARCPARLGSLTERGTGGFDGRGVAPAGREAHTTAPSATRPVAAPPTRSPWERAGPAGSLCTQPPGVTRMPNPRPTARASRDCALHGLVVPGTEGWR